MNKPSDSRLPLTRRAVLAVAAVLAVVAMTLSYLPEWTTSKGDRRNSRRELIRQMSELPPLTADNFRPVQVVLRPPLVEGFELKSVAEAKQHVDADETVLAVTINGQSRAYPINVMTGPAREVFNDTLGGRAIAATW